MERPARTVSRSRSGRRRRWWPDLPFWAELPLLAVVAVVLTFLVQTFVAKGYVVPSGSMETTLHGCDGCTDDRVLVDRLTYDVTAVHAGDVVVFRGPPGWTDPEDGSGGGAAPGEPGLLARAGALVGFTPPGEEDFVKRVIAVGGQTVACCDASGRVTVDGRPLDEPYVTYPPDAGPPPQSRFGPVVVPVGQFWMMGDNRNDSADSRVHGPVPRDEVIGRVRLVVLPPGRFRWIG